MKRTLLILAIILFSCNKICLAQQSSKASSDKTKSLDLSIISPKVAKTNILWGKIESIILPDSSKKSQKSEVTIIDEKSGKALTILIKSTTFINDSSFNTVNLKDLKKEDKVRVRYLTTKEGIKEAISINLIRPIKQIGTQ